MRAGWRELTSAGADWLARLRRRRRPAALLREAGFRDVRVRTVSRSIRFEEGAVFVRMNAMALVGMSAGGGTLGAEERGRVIDAIVADSAPVSRGEGAALSFEIATNLATAGG